MKRMSVFIACVGAFGLSVDALGDVQSLQRDLNDLDFSLNNLNKSLQIIVGLESSIDNIIEQNKEHTVDYIVDKVKDQGFAKKDNLAFLIKLLSEKLANKRGSSKAWIAALINDDVAAEWLRNTGEQDLGLDTEDSAKMTPLFYALSFNNSRMARALVDKGANVNKPWREKFPLHYVLDKGQIDLAEFFVKNGADTSSAMKIIEEKIQSFEKMSEELVNAKKLFKTITSSKEYQNLGAKEKSEFSQRIQEQVNELEKNFAQEKVEIDKLKKFKARITKK